MIVTAYAVSYNMLMLAMDGVRPQPGRQTKALVAARPAVGRVMMDIVPQPLVAAAAAQTAAISYAAPLPAQRRFNLPALQPFAVAAMVLALVATATLGLQHLSVSSTAAAPSIPADRVPSAKPAAAAPQGSAELQRLIGRFTPSVGVAHGLVVKDLNGSAQAGSNQQRVFTSASLYKLFVAQATYRAIDDGEISLGDRAGSSGRSVADCLRLMITVSDNPCGHALGARLGWGRYNGVLKTQGFTSTSLNQPLQTSAADVALLLERLYHGTLLSPNSTAQFLDLLKAQRVNNRLPAGLPAGTTIAHKTGDLAGLMHDAGIVYGPKTDYLVVMTSGPWSNPAAAPASFADLSAQLWRHFSSP